jgi:PAS domain S-box-containing protein
MGKPLNVLIIEDSEDDTLFLLRELEKGGYTPVYQRVETTKAMRAALQEKTWDIILSDYHLPRFSGLQALMLFKETGIDIPFILVSGMIGEELAVEAMKAGAHDYIMKGNLARLIPAIERELREVEERQKRRRMEHELQKEKDRAGLYLEIAGVMIVVINQDGLVTLINRKGCEILGYARDEIIGKNWFDTFIPEEIRSEERESFFKILSGDIKPMEYHENPLVTKEGKERLISWYNNFLIDQSGKIIGSLSSGEDITERKLMEKELRESEERYRDLIENVNDVLYVFDDKGTFNYVSSPVQTMLGYSPSELVGRNLDEFVYPADQPYVKDQFQKVLSGQVEPSEYRILNKAGEICWVRASSRAIIKEDTILGLRGLLTDISQRKKAEDQNQQTLINLRKAMGGIIQAMAATVETRDPYTAGHQRRVADLGRAIAREMKLTDHQIDGIRMAGIVHDLGKISIPAEILSKPTKLSEIEFSLIKTHPQVSYDILKDIDFPWPVAQTVFQHHERINGSGYPLGLKGEEILLEARILAVADVVEAIASHRPYRPAYGIEAALNQILKERGALYDTAAVDACLKLFKEQGFVLE